DQHGLEQTSTARLASVSRAGQLLSSELVEQARREAIADWITTGLTPGQILALQNATVQITDLNSEGAFGFAGSRMIQLDDDALGFGWHVGSGPVPTGAVDLGTVMRHELGHILGYGDLDPATAGDSIMSGTILPGERRVVPVVVARGSVDSATETGQAPGYAGQNEQPGCCDGQADAAQSALTGLVNPFADTEPKKDQLRSLESAGRKGLISTRSPLHPEAAAVLTFASAQAEDLQLLDSLFTDPLEVFHA
ncbi:MAG: hypothetical protein ACK5BP_21040, partial [Planctomyces sp.]